MRILSWLSFFALLPAAALASPKITLDLPGIGRASASANASPPKAVIQTESGVVWEEPPPSPASAHDTKSAPKVRSYSLSKEVSAVVFRFPLRDGGEDVVLSAIRGGKIMTLLRQSFPARDEPGQHLDIADLDGDGFEEILRYTTDELAFLCDGEEARLGASAYNPETDAWEELEIAPIPALGAPLLPDSSFRPPPPPKTPVAHWNAASSREGFSQASSAAGLLEDERAETVWIEGRKGPGLGEFVTSAVRGSRQIAAVGIQPPLATGVSAPSVVLLVVGNGARGRRLALKMPERTKAGEFVWFLLKEPLPATCVSVVLAEAPSGSARLGLGGIRLVAVQELSPEKAQAAFLKDLGAKDYLLAQQAMEGLSGLPPDEKIDEALAGIVLDPLESGARKEAALTALGRRKADGARALEAYAKALSHPDEAVRRAGVAALLGTGEAAGPVLRAALQGPTLLVAARAAREALLEGLSPEALLPALLAALGQGSLEEREAVREALLAAQSASLLEVTEKLKEANPIVRADAARVLGALGARSPSRDLCAALLLALSSEEEFEPRYALIAALEHARQGDLEAVGAKLGEILQNDPEDIIRARAASVFGKEALWPPAPLFSALSDPSPRVRAAALSALARRKESTAAKALGTLLQNDEWAFVRAKAAEALVLIAGKEAKDPLIAALKDPDRKVALAAIAALRAAQIRDASPALADLVADKEAGRERRVEAAAALGELGGAPEAAVLLKTLQEHRYLASRSEGAEELAVTCALALALLGAKDAYDELEAMVLRGPGPIIQKAGVKALGILGDVRAIPLLKKAAAQTEDLVLAKVAKEALEQITGREAEN